MAREIEVTISADGSSTTVDLKGFKGKGCKAVADAFSALGKAKDSKIKPEYYDDGKKTHVTTGA